MKVFKIVMVAVFMLGIATATANDFTTRVYEEANEPQIKVQSVEANRFRIFYQGTLKENVRLSIYDTNRERVYSEDFRGATAFAKLYDFNSLPQGTYYIEVSGKGWRKKEKVERSKLALDKGFEVNLTQMEGGSKVLLEIDDPEIKEVALMIEDRRGEILFNDKVELTQEGKRVIRFEGYVNGAYTFRVFSGTQAQTEVLSLGR